MQERTFTSCYDSLSFSAVFRIPATAAFGIQQGFELIKLFIAYFCAEPLYGLPQIHAFRFILHSRQTFAAI